MNAKKNANKATGNAARIILCERYADGNFVVSVDLLILCKVTVLFVHDKPIEHENNIKE